MPARNLPIRRKLTLLMMLTSGVALLLACVALLAFELSRSRSEMADELRSTAQLVGSNSAVALAFHDPKAAEEALASLSFRPQVVSAGVYGVAGRPFAVYHRQGSETDWTPAAPGPDGVRPGRAAVEVTEPIVLGGERIGTIYVKADLRGLAARLRGYSAVVLLVMLASMATAFLFASRLQGMVSAPVLRLTEAVRVVSTTRDYSLRVPEGGGDELGVLTASFNAMLSRIEAQDTELRTARDELEERVRARVLDLRREVQEREEAQEALRLGELKFRTIVETTSDWIRATDAQGRSTYDNPAVERILGYRPEELRGRNAAELFHPDDRQAALDIMKRAVESAAGWSGAVVRFRHRNGSYRHLESAAAPVFDPSGALTGFQGSAHDITEHRLLEEQLRQSQKMEAVGRLAGGIAHDFNNLLGVILGYSDMLLRRDPNGAGAAKIEQIRSAADRAAGLTRQLLAFSRKQTLDPKVLDLNAVVADLSRMLPRLLGEDVDLSIVAAPDLGTVKADRGQLEQVLMNLAVNARDAMPRGGRLTIETLNVELDAATASLEADGAAGSFVQLLVTDTGEGMRPEVRAHIFEPFFTTKEQGKGTGLGLATVYGIVKQSGGHLSVNSEPGRGSTFRIYLPRADESVGPRKEEPDAITRRGSGRVLLVEDEDALRDLVTEMLEASGYTVLRASNGIEALDLAARQPAGIDLLLTDVVMPGMSGPEVANRLAPHRPAMKVIYMSGYTDDALGRHVLDAGTNLLHKPFTQDALALRIKEVLVHDGNLKALHT